MGKGQDVAERFLTDISVSPGGGGGAGRQVFVKFDAGSGCEGCDKSARAKDRS